MPSTAFVLPPPQAVRPACCPHCKAICGQPGSYNLWSHGPRWRDVVVPDATPEGKGAYSRAWSRRFLCRRCGRTCSVSPPGVLPRQVFTLAAVLRAWFLAVAPPLGDGCDDRAVYALLGVDRRTATRETYRAGVQRWRSLRRWVDLAGLWWPTRPLTGVTWRQRAGSLLLGFLPGDEGRDGAIRRAVSAHVAGGTAM